MFNKNPDDLASFSSDHFLYPAVLNERYFNGIMTAWEKAYELFLNLENKQALQS